MHGAGVTEGVTLTGQIWPWFFLGLVQHQTSLISRHFFLISMCTILRQENKTNKTKNKKAKAKTSSYIFLLETYLTFTFHVPFTIRCTSALPDYILFSKMDFPLSCLKHPHDLCFRLFQNHHMLDNCAQRNYFQSGLNTKEKHTANFFSRAVQTFP